MTGEQERGAIFDYLARAGCSDPVGAYQVLRRLDGLHQLNDRTHVIYDKRREFSVKILIDSILEIETVTPTSRPGLYFILYRLVYKLFPWLPDIGYELSINAIISSDKIHDVAVKMIPYMIPGPDGGTSIICFYEPITDILYVLELT